MVEIGPGPPFFAFPCSSTIYGAGEKNPRFFDFFSYFWGHFEDRSSRDPVGKTKFPLQTVYKGNFDFPKGPWELRFSRLPKKYEKNSKNPGFFSPAPYIVEALGNAKKPAVLPISRVAQWIL